MKVRTLAVAGLVLALMHPAIADVISDAGLSQEDINGRFVESVGLGKPLLPGGLKALGADTRVALVKTVGAALMAWSKTADFRQRYADWRAEGGPEKPNLISPEDMQKQNADAKLAFDKQITDLDASIADTEAKRPAYKQAGLTDEQINELISGAKHLRDSVVQGRADGTIPNAPVQMTEAQRQSQNAAAEAQYKAAVAAFTAAHPADANAVIKKELTTFLAVAPTVNFDAAVGPNGAFVNPDDEKQSELWKMCYRAGRPAVGAATEIARTWLAQL